jgi:quercetin dioxygenase-like cupin family protein
VPREGIVRAVDIRSGRHYRWGASSEGWHLLDGADLSVIQERVAPGDQERRHRHAAARQFFYILTGQATLEIDGAQVVREDL